MSNLRTKHVRDIIHVIFTIVNKIVVKTFSLQQRDKIHNPLTPCLFNTPNRIQRVNNEPVSFKVRV